MGDAGLMPLDHKYIGEIRKIETGELLDPEEFVIFRVKDLALSNTLRHYWETCRALGSPLEHLDAILALRERVQVWQQEHPEQCKVPD